MTSAWEVISEICRVNMDEYAEAFSTSRETIELSIDEVPGVEILETDGAIAIVKVDARSHPTHLSIFCSLRTAVQGRRKWK